MMGVASADGGEEGGSDERDGAWWWWWVAVELNSGDAGEREKKMEMLV